MRRLALLAPLLAVVGLVDTPAQAGEKPLNSGCQITSNGSVGSSASDTDCVFVAGRWYTFQCDQPVYYRADGVDPTSTSPKATFPGDPYPFAARGATVQPLKILNVSAAATCNVFESDG